jgi:pilus assembly protein CpaC
MASLFLIALPLLGLLQGPTPSAPQAMTLQTQQPEYKPVPLAVAKVHSVTLVVGRGELLQFADVVDRVAVSEPAIADAVVVGPQEVVVNAKTPGLTTVLVWHKEGLARYDITVQPDLSTLERQIQSALPNELIRVSSSKDAVLLTGVVTSQEVATRAAAIAAMYSKQVVNLLQAPQPENRQVMLQVKFATVDRTALSQLGVNLFSTNPKLLGTLTTQEFQFPRIGQLQVQNGQVGNLQVSVSDLLNLFAFRPDLNVGATLKLLQANNLLEILAEPNLITVSGKEASFLAGGEFPFPVITTSGSGGTAAPVVTIQFRKFGVQLNFTPTVEANGNIHLKVKPEVSSLDFANALTIQGFLIPAISTRVAETEVDLKDGESFAIAGLIDNRVSEIVSKIPWIGNVPIIGNLFKTRSRSKTNTELLVVITPRYVRPQPAGTSLPLPNFPSNFLDGSNPGAGQPKFVGPRGHLDAEETKKPEAPPKKQ